MNPVVRDTDKLLHVKPSRKRPAVEVTQDRANSHDPIAAFDKGADVLVEERTFIHANMVGVLLVNDRLIHEHRGERQVRGIDEGTNLRLKASAREKKAGQDACGLRLLKRADDGPDGGVE